MAELPPVIRALAKARDEAEEEKIELKDIPGFLESVQVIIREEIIRALGTLSRSAHYEGGVTDSEFEQRAANVIMSAAEGAVLRLTCPHQDNPDWGYDHYCARCGELEPRPTGRVRQCPVSPESCAPLVGWGTFCTHVYEAHTSGSEAHRIEATDRILKGLKTNGAS